MAEIRTYTVTLGQLTNNGVVCTDPVISLVNAQGLSFTCIDEASGTYKVEVLGELSSTSLQFLVQCEQCGDCPPEIIDVTICDDIDDCGPCEECVNGTCQSVCEPDEVCDNGVCVDCLSNEDCPCNQVCINGSCTCPPSLPTLEGDCCIECDGNEDCDICEVCVGGQCVPNTCGDFVCNPATGDCVECISSGDCTGANQCCINNECQCCPGFVLVDGECVPAPECTTDTDCDPCEVCVNGVCVPQQCPPGQVCVDEFGCVDECDCNDPTSCDDITQFCYQGSNGLCGCIPCQGDCTAGCESPCYCDPNLNQCIVNNCDGPCTNGLDCGEGCGCLNGQCVPCSTLDCTTSQCAQALGCSCQGTVCTDSDNPCSDTPCSTASDCAVGCTCYEGECVSCDNFPCTPNECSDYDGCGCVGGDCVGVEDACTDTLEFVQDNDACTLTGRLVKDNCCACPQLTADSRGLLVSSTTDGAVVSFIAELRKGAFNGISVTTNPLLNDFTNSNIAENEPPTSGTVRLTYVVNRDIFTIQGSGARVYIGTVPDAPVSIDRSFSAAGTAATLSYNNVAFPQIGSEVIDGSEARVVASVDITFTIVSAIDFPNECTYGTGVISTYSINNFSVFPPTYGNGKATTITSGDCRLPFFRWTKSEDGTFDEVPFRKIYIDGSGTYEDQLSTREEGLESCHYYLLEVDCTCKDPINKYVIFCKPEELDFEVTRCGYDLTINSFETCDPNQDIQYYVNAGSIALTFTAATAPIGVTYTSTSLIETVEYGISCDEPGICTKEYEVVFGELTPSYTTECSAGGDTFDVEFTSTSTVPGCNLSYVFINGTNVFPGIPEELPTGVYSATAYWDCGCDPTVFEVSEDCCDIDIPEISRDCDGVVCSTAPGVTYTFNGIATVDVCSLVNGLTASESATVIATREGCLAETFILPPLTDICCVDFEAYTTELSPTELLVTVVNANGTVTVVVDDAGVTVTDNLDGTYTLSPVASGTTYTITVTDSLCGDLVIEHVFATVEPCPLDPELGVTNPCLLRVVPNAAPCMCCTGEYHISIDNVTDLGTQWEVEYTTSLEVFDAFHVAGTLTVEGVAETDVEVSGTVVVDKPLTTTANCVNNMLIQSTTNTGAGGTTLTHTISFGGTGNILTSGDWTNIVVVMGGEVANVVGTGFQSNQTFTHGQSISLTIQAENVADGELYLYTGTVIVAAATLTGLPFCEVDLTAGNSSVTFELSGLELEDACTYPTESWTLYIDGAGRLSNPSNPHVLTLVPIDPLARKVKYEWYKDNTWIFTDWQYGNSTLPENVGFYEQGSTYRVEVDCKPCAETVQQVLCCPIEVETEIVAEPTVETSGQTNLAITISVNDTKPDLEEDVVFTVIVSNVSANDATGVEAEITIPDGLYPQSDVATQGTTSLAAGGAFTTTTWDVGTVAAGNSATLLLTAKGCMCEGSINNTATISALDQTDVNLANNTDSQSVEIQCTGIILDCELCGYPAGYCGDAGAGGEGCCEDGAMGCACA